MNFKNYITEEKKDKSVEEIINFFRDNPKPKDSSIHSLSDKLGIDTHKFEEIIYGLIGSFFGAGMAFEKGFEEKDADPEQLKMGIKVEMEHTNSELLGKKIALDHIAEFPTGKYYTNLLKMEKEIEKNK